MFLKKSIFTILFFTFICISCRNNDVNKVRIKVKNNTTDTIIFDHPTIIFSALEFENNDKNYINKNINIIRRIEKLNIESGGITLFYDIPSVEMITLKPDERYKTTLIINDLDTSIENEYIFFILKKDSIEDLYDYNNYIDDMKRVGFYINKKIKGKNININITESDLKKMTPLAEEDFPALYDLYNQE